MKRIILATTVLFIGCDEHKGHEYPDMESGIVAIIPFGMGGGTGQAFRAVKDQLEKHLEVAVTGVSIPGNGGFDGLHYFWNNRHKANFLYFGALKSIETYVSNGAWGDEKPVGIDKLSPYSIWKTPDPIVAVSSKSTIFKPQHLISQLRFSVLEIATAGNYTAGDIGARTLSNILGAQYRPNRRSSGRAAVESALVGESDIVIALYSEMQEEIESGKIRPLLMIGERPGIYEHVIIDALGDYVEEEIPEMGVTFGFVVPNDIPEETKARLDRAWSLVNVQAISAEKNNLPRVISGEVALKELQAEIDADRWATSNKF